MDTNMIYNENCLDTMKRMPDCFIDLTVTSPPYDNLRDYNGYEFDFECIALELYRVTKQGGVIVWIVNDATINGSETGTSFKQALFFMECGFNLHDTMFYKRYSQPNSHNTRYKQVVEYMFILSKGKPNAINLIKERAKDYRPNGKLSKKRNKDGSQTQHHQNLNEFVPKEVIWEYSVGDYGSTKDKIAFKHPAIFPEQLAADHIYSWSNEGDLVYDCFGGSGTTAKMAHLLKRKWILSEISKDYTEVSRRRIAPYLAQGNLFDYNNKATG